jgi:hypothetical protein
MYSDAEILKNCQQNQLTETYLSEFREKNKPEDVKSRSQTNPIENFYVPLQILEGQAQCWRLHPPAIDCGGVATVAAEHLQLPSAQKIPGDSSQGVGSRFLSIVANQLPVHHRGGKLLDREQLQKMPV